MSTTNIHLKMRSTSKNLGMLIPMARIMQGRAYSRNLLKKPIGSLGFSALTNRKAWIMKLDQ